MIVKTDRFGEIEVTEDEKIFIPNGILGFPEENEYFLVDPEDDTFILWLQSIKTPHLCFPVLEPKIFKPDYMVRLSASELRELKMEGAQTASVFSILTIPSDISLMTANLKAPLVINNQQRLARQVVLQENEYSIKFPMFKELRVHLMVQKNYETQKTNPAESPQVLGASALRVIDIPPSVLVHSL